MGNIQTEVAVYDDLDDCVGFEWDDGNQDKNWRKHRVTDAECEQIFFEQPLIALEDVDNSRKVLPACYPQDRRLPDCNLLQAKYIVSHSF